MLNAHFFTTIAHIRDLPTDSLREVAFAGRSNAGKSSAINVIANQKRLAFASKTPGRTQHLNFFETQPGRFLVDLPGYGFAKAPFTQQRAWQQLIGGYLSDRRPLVGLVLIMDIRHPLTDLDRHLLDWFRPTGKPIHVLLAKSDKLSRSQAMTTQRAVQTEMNEAGFTAKVQIFSSTHRVGLEEAEAMVRVWLDMVKEIKETVKETPANPPIPEASTEASLMPPSLPPSTTQG
jgi:GTP-binding protein